MIHKNKKNYDRITKLVAESHDFMKAKRKDKYLKPEYVVEGMFRYAKATREGRLLAVIHSVSNSGMTRTMSFHSTERFEKTVRDGRKYSLTNYYSLFMGLGYTTSRSNRDAFQIKGCGMNMVFATHYDIIHSIHRCGIINKEEFSKLCQMTPPYL